MDSHNRDHPLLGAFLAGELGPAEARRWDEHLLECEACWRAVREDRAGRPGLSCHERARAQLLRNEKGENASDDCRHIARH